MLVKVLKKLTIAILMLALIQTGSLGEAAAKSKGNHPAVQKTFKNPVIGDGADPWVIQHSDGFYYYTQTTGGNITIWKTKDLTKLSSAEKKTVWTPEKDAPNREHLWAPELHFIEGKWYIYYAASDGDMGKQRMYVLESDTDNPMGSYHHPEGTNFGKITDPSDKWAIDGTVLSYKGKIYFVWSGWEGDENVSQNLYIAPMKNPWTIGGKRVEISRPELAWEKNGTPLINEGPQILKNKQGRVFIIYSASGSWTDDYCLGLLELNGRNPLLQDSWTKKEQPVFKSDPAMNVYGPGHNSFVKSPDGKQDWIVYHAAKFKGAGWNRSVRMQEFFWNKDGTPDFRKPVAVDSILKAPSEGSGPGVIPGQPGKSYKYEAEKALVNHARVVENSGASGGAKVGMIDFEDSYIDFSVDVPKGDYILKVRYSNGMGEETSHILSVNGVQQELFYQPFGWDSWKEAEKEVTLNEGQNSIRLGKGKLFTEIDSIELVPKNVKIFKYEAELADIKSGEMITDALASNKLKMAAPKGSKAVFKIRTDRAGEYNLTVRTKTEAGKKQQIFIAGARKGVTVLNSSGKDWGSYTVKTSLQAGINTIVISSPGGKAEYDYISLEETGKK
ncbi:family 43 glycosylhydrolase [Peribacillus sp. SCS-37]|uniref:family 43 glycosylhydrolase n=1 Tax=Paraperibacillus esterisolvens TaxID=3115296 RepID=UPI003906C048